MDERVAVDVEKQTLGEEFEQAVEVGVRDDFTKFEVIQYLFVYWL